MDKELKIIWGSTTQDTKVLVNNIKIELISKIIMNINASTGYLNLELTFPNFLGDISNIDDFCQSIIEYKDNSLKKSTYDLKIKLINSLMLLDGIPNIQVIIEPTMLKTTFFGNYIIYNDLIKILRLKAFW